MTTRTDVIVDFQPSPRVVEVASPSTEITIQDLVDTLRVNEEAFTKGLAFPKLIDAAGKEDLGGGVLVGITANLQDAQVSFEARTTPAQTGTVTTGSSAPVIGYITFEDTGADFVAAGVVRGSLVINFTDQSIADVVDVISSTSLRTKVLVNGGTNAFSVADDYQVFNVIQCNISGGNLVAVDGAVSSISPAVPTAFTQIIRTASSSATLSESQDIQYSSFGGGVTVDVLGTSSGTTFPTGTQRQPVNNMVDALSIAQTRGLDKFLIIGDITLATSVFNNFVFEGQSTVRTTITIDPSASIIACEFENCLLSGALTGDTYMAEVALKNVTGLVGHLEQCVIREGTNVLGGSGDIMFNKCVASSADGPGVDIPILDCAGSGQNISFRGLIGEIEIINKTGSEPMSIALNGARVELDSTVTDGNIRVFGVGTIIDNSGGTAVVDRSELVAPEYNMEAVWSATAASFNVSGSMGEVMNDLWSMATGKIVESPSGTFTFYDRDNVTVKYTLTKAANERTRS